MQRHKMPIPQPKTNLKLPNAKEILNKTTQYFLAIEGKKMQWLPPYDQVADWLTDNKGKGLLLYGNVGQSKTTLIRYVLPAILLQYHQKVTTVHDIGQLNTQEKLDHTKTKKIISLDDIGTESTLRDYGSTIEPFAQLIDHAEKYNTLLLISTNLGKDQLIARYGDRVFERILTTTHRILFTGKSLRTQ